MVSLLFRFSAWSCLPFGAGAGVVFEAEKYHVLPMVLHVAACRNVVELEKTASVNPALEGRLVEIVRTPVRCDTVLEDADFGVKVKAARLLR